MKYLIDTSIWSLAFRRSTKRNDKIVDLLTEIIDNNLAVFCGPIRQELLSGIKQPEQFNQLKARLRHFPDLTINIRDYELAAEYFNICRSKGVQASNTDFLLCSLAVNNGLILLTADQDFLQIEKHTKVKIRFIKL